MTQARLNRTDAVEEMAVAVDAFRNEAIAAVESLDMQIRRALEWIHHDRHEHWDHQVRRGWERISEARIELQQARTARRVDDHDPACIDEKKALARAKQRLEIAQEKVEAVRHCTRAIDRAVDDYRGARTPLSSWLEAEGPKALSVLRRMLDNLEDYLALQGAGSRERGAGSRERGAGSGERGAGSGEQGAGSGEQGAGSGEQGAGSGERGARSGELGGGDTAAYSPLQAPGSKLPAPCSPLPASDAGGAP